MLVTTPDMTGATGVACGAGGASLAGRIAMEKQSVTAPGLRSEHGTRLPYAPQLTVLSLDTTALAAAAGTGSPPRGAPV